MSELTIGSLADEAGVNVETIRYYQRRGLMPEPDKPAQGYRRYDATTVKRVRFIKRAQALGFTLGGRSAACSNSTRPMPAPKRANWPRTSYKRSKPSWPIWWQCARHSRHCCASAMQVR